MKLLLTSAGIANDSIRDALVDLLGRPVEEATAVLIPTAIYALPDRDRLERTRIYYDDEYDEAAPAGAGSDWTLGLVDFEIRPHLNADYFPVATMEFMERVVAKLDVPLYAFDETALKVVDGKVEDVSEGQWRLFDAATRR